MNKADSNNNVFEWFLIVTAAITVCIGGYESYAQRYWPAYSILGLLQLHGYLKGYPVIYAPSKGIWLPVAWTGAIMMVVMMLYSIREGEAQANYERGPSGSLDAGNK
ncbi:MAG: hypothetical protein HY026_08425 [Deltaproteobacteria bacterium]|nr:hypothetical protein [Deltaproteobacteria bacterium]